MKWAFSRREDDPRTLIESGEPILTSGVHDALSARLIEKAGSKAAVMGGYATSACLLGKPDVGLLTMTEMSTQLRYICSATGIPVIADGDTGHGNAINVIRTVQEFEAAGAAGILLEDQVAPKKCGHMEGKQVIPKEQHVRKIQAACEARRDPDFIIIARTDARSVNGPDDAIDRALACKDAGADVLFVEAPIDVAELEEIARRIKAPLVADIIEGGKTPLLDVTELNRMGYQIIFYNLGSLYTITRALMDYYDYVVRHGASKGFTGPVGSFEEFNSLIGLDEIKKLEKRYLRF
ncbi:MAG: oxaloacetate decarboxylase [Firmicutes bacterium]|nr:oxaloacetate decarboxylase [Bacillota bacterium]